VNRPWQPCGTRAAYRRHLRHGEQPCRACLAAEREGDRAAKARARAADTREARNGLPVFVPYTYRGTGYDQLTPHL
jgi:hypothetical protein